MWVPVVVLKPWDQVLWFVKHEVRVTLVNIPEPMRNLGRKKSKMRWRDQSKKAKPAMKYFCPCLVLVSRLLCVYSVVWNSMVTGGMLFVLMCFWIYFGEQNRSDGSQDQISYWRLKNNFLFLRLSLDSSGIWRAVGGDKDTERGVWIRCLLPKANSPDAGVLTGTI